MVPAQIGLLLPAAGATGVCLIVTEVVPAAVGGHPATATTTEYVPAAEVGTEVIVGFWLVEV